MTSGAAYPAVLVLENGRVFRGRGFGAKVARHGEVVFNTSITGYQEIVSDPSYCGQIVVAYLACRQMMPDPAFYDRCIRESFEELEKAALAARARIVAPHRKGRSRTSPAAPKRRVAKPTASVSVTPPRAKSPKPMK